MSSLKSLVVSLCLLSTLYLPGDAVICESRPNCSSCLATAGCGWCATLNFDGIRCSRNLTNDVCNDIEMSTGGITGMTMSGSDNPISITNINLTLGVDVPETFTVSVTTLRDLPLDLYVLIDLSGSMNDELNALQSVAGDIATRINNVTNNVRIGFGSFNDKVTRPFTYFVESNPDGSCPVPVTDNIRCVNYAFRHEITLTDNVTFYAERVRDIRISANADNPENGLEALAQIMACEDIIGWRSREATGRDRGNTRVVLYMTDAGFHYSGEGQLAGILKPYEGECLMEPAQSPDQRFVEFTKWDEVDYPSVGQVIQMLDDNRLFVIFATQASSTRTFQNLAELINKHHRATVAELVEDGTSILNLIDEEYRRLLQEVPLTPINDGSSDLVFTITPICPAGSNATAIGCVGVPLEATVNFEVTVTLTNCDNFQGSRTPRTRTLSSRDFGTFTITYTGDCMCDCQAENRRDNNAERCNGNGDFVCGVCECDSGWCGTACELKIGTACDCESLTDDCPRNNGSICSGNGACCEGNCVCRENEDGFVYRHNGTRADCACEPEEVVCRDPEDITRTCVNGDCGCSGCECQSMYAGRLCDSRSTVVCLDTMDVECLTQCVSDENTCQTCEATRPILTYDSTTANIGDNLNEFTTQLVTSHSGDSTYTSQSDCQVEVGICRYDYFLFRNSEQTVIIVLDTARDMCVEPSRNILPFEPWILVFIVIGILLILGVIIFILIKVIISILDYMEVKRWEKETKDADFSKNQNPLYQSPEMKYENVAYGRE